MIYLASNEPQEINEKFEQIPEKEKWFYSIILYHLGFITLDVHYAHSLKYEIIGREFVVKRKDELFSINPELRIDNDFVPEKRFIYDWENLLEISNLHLGYIAQRLIWHKKQLDCSTSKQTETICYELTTTEEVGFIEIGNWIFARTIQPWLIEIGSKPRVSESCMVAIPAFPKPYKDEQFINLFGNTKSLGGGVQYQGNFLSLPLTIEFKSNWSIPQTIGNVMVCVDAIDGNQINKLEQPDNDGKDTFFIDWDKVNSANRTRLN